MTSAMLPTWRETVLRLDSLAAQISTTLIGLGVDDMDAAFAHGVQLIGEVLDADRSALLEFTGDDSPFEVVGSWTRPGVSTVAEDTDGGWMRWITGRLVCDGRMRWTIDDLRHDAIAGTDPGSPPIRSAIGVPVTVGGTLLSVLAIASAGDGNRWDTEVGGRLQLLAEILTAAISRRRQERTLRLKEAELARLTTRLKSEANYLREEIETLQGFPEIIGGSSALEEALERVREVASTDATVLLVGETGTGKELLARALHDRSPRRRRPLVRVNCAALPPTLIESELFGHERGAFTGAIGMRQGRFELADKGTIFLDEIGDLPLELQAKLLRVLQEGEFERVGSSHIRRVDVRVISATHRNLAAAIASGGFRADLYYRLSVFPIQVPALRERLEDIPQLVWFFVHRRQRALHRHITSIPGSVMEALQCYAWPGNVRELENVVERAMIRATGDTLALDSSFGQSSGSPGRSDGDTLEAFERRHIEHVLRRCGWRINGVGNAAQQLNVHPNTLRFRMKKLGLARPVRLVSPPDASGADTSGVTPARRHRAS